MRGIIFNFAPKVNCTGFILHGVRGFWYNVRGLKTRFPSNFHKGELMKKLEGLIAAAHTPFNADGSINYGLVKKQAETLIKQKVTGVYVSGTTG